MSQLPDIAPENFCEARSVFQSTLSSTGAVLTTMAIQEDQNGKKAWHINLESSGCFPAPSHGNFVAVRAVLNAHVPTRGILRTIELAQTMSNPTMQWEVLYGVASKKRRHESKP